MPPRTLNQILEGRRSQPNQLIEVLQDVQESYGYISKEAMKAAAEGLGVPLMEVYRVATFYKAFKLKPCGKNHLIMCMGTACHVRGARLPHGAGSEPVWRRPRRSHAGRAILRRTCQLSGHLRPGTNRQGERFISSSHDAREAPQTYRVSASPGNGG